MSTKVYLTMPCDIMKKDVPISYEVIYYYKIPKLGQVKCEKNPEYCNLCPMKKKTQEFAARHFNDVYQREFSK